MTPTMFETPLLEAPTAEGYRAALKALAERAQAFLDEENADSLPLSRHARQLAKEMREHNLQPRQRLTRTEVHHNALRRFIDAVDEFVELESHDGQLVSAWDVWDSFRAKVRAAAADAERYGPDDTTWAPEDDSNPPKTTPVPEPDPTAPPINGVRQGDWVKIDYEATPRRVLTGVTDRHFGESVRLSDPKDGTWFGGFWVPASDIGERYLRVEPPADAERGGSTGGAGA